MKPYALNRISRRVNALEKSLCLNKLQYRARIEKAVVTTENGVIGFNTQNSVEGHIDSTADLVPAISFSEVLTNNSKGRKTLIKMDIEGYEVVLLKELSKIKKKELNSLTFVIELHPQNFNNTGSPKACLNTLLSLKASIYDLNGEQIADPSDIDELQFTQIIADFN